MDGRTLTLNAEGPEFEPQFHSKDFILECGFPRAEFSIPVSPLAYPALMGACKGVIQATRA